MVNEAQAHVGMVNEAQANNSWLRRTWEAVVKTCGLEFEPLTDDYDMISESIHVRQKSMMDCGTACIEMVLRWSGARRDCFLPGSLAQPCWTIDLFIFLNECESNVTVSMFTLVRGFAEENSLLNWYRNHMQQADIDRCNSQFALAEQRGWMIQHSGQLSMQDIAARVSNPNVVAIVLVDDSLLKERGSDTYRGHYILLVGFNDSQCIYLDPATDASPKRVNVDELDAARSALGTDCDIIFCEKCGEK